MTMYTTQTLLANVVYGVPSGNYTGTSPDFVSNAVPAASYYGGQGSVQTFTMEVDGFQGVITLQATLNDLQESTPWFDIATYGNVGNATTGGSAGASIGNFTWIRANITDYNAGNITLVTITY